MAATAMSCVHYLSPRKSFSRFYATHTHFKPLSLLAGFFSLKASPLADTLDPFGLIPPEQYVRPSHLRTAWLGVWNARSSVCVIVSACL